MKQNRRKHTPSFKAREALEAEARQEAKHWRSMHLTSPERATH
ncbi:hypothetical protein ACFLWG_00670 [Chloroflexota bacterium]